MPLRIRVRSFAVVVCLLASAKLVLAQETRRAVQPSVESPPVAPVSRGPDPDAARIGEFHANLGVIAEDADRTVRLANARRIAPFDLTWGLP